MTVSLIPTNWQALDAAITRALDDEAVCREFAVKYPTPSVLSAIGHGESGRLPWSKIAALFERSLRAGVMAVSGG